MFISIHEGLRADDMDWQEITEELKKLDQAKLLRLLSILTCVLDPNY